VGLEDWLDLEKEMQRRDPKAFTKPKEAFKKAKVSTSLQLSQMKRH